MADVVTIGNLGRIEDFLVLAKEGMEVSAEVELRKQVVCQKVHPEETEDMKDEMNMYLLQGNFIFSFGNETQKISKVYMFGAAEESAVAAKVNKSIANERLRVDYGRLKDTHITVKEKYF